MKSSKHMKIAGALQLLQGIQSLLFGAYGALPIILGLQGGSNDLAEMFEFLPTLILAIIILAGTVQTWFGIALIKQRQWVTRPAGFICCVPSFFPATPPVLVGVYTLWVLVQINKQKALSES